MFYLSKKLFFHIFQLSLTAFFNGLNFMVMSHDMGKFSPLKKAVRDS